MATTTVKDGFNGGSDNQLLVNADGSINVNSSGGGSGTSNVNIHDASGNALTSTSGALNVNTSGTSTVTGSVGIQGLAAFETSQYVVGTAAIQLTPSPLANRSAMNIKVICTGSNVVYVGNSSSVTTTTGFPLFNGDTIQIDLQPTQPLYVIATGAGQLVYVLEIG